MPELIVSMRNRLPVKGLHPAISVQPEFIALSHVQLFNPLSSGAIISSPPPMIQIIRWDTVGHQGCYMAR